MRDRNFGISIVTIAFGIISAMVIIMSLPELTRSQQGGGLIGLLIIGSTGMLILHYNRNAQLTSRQVLGTDGEHRSCNCIDYTVYALLCFEHGGQVGGSTTFNLTIDIFLPVGTKVSFNGQFYEIYKIDKDSETTTGRAGIPTWYLKKYTGGPFEGLFDEGSYDA